MVNLFQFQVTENVGALSMQVLGNLKNVFTSTVSVFVFRNAVTSQHRRVRYHHGGSVVVQQREEQGEGGGEQRRRRAVVGPGGGSGQVNARERPCERLRLISSHALLLQ